MVWPKLALEPAKFRQRYCHVCDSKNHTWGECWLRNLGDRLWSVENIVLQRYEADLAKSEANLAKRKDNEAS